MPRLFCLCLALLLLPALALAEDPAPGKQMEQALREEGKDEPRCEYLLFLPEGYGEGGKKWPLMLFLHGRGESNGPLSLVKKWGPPRDVESDPKFPYVLVSPQCPRSESWNQDRQQQILSDLLDEIIKKYGWFNKHTASGNAKRGEQ